MITFNYEFLLKQLAIISASETSSLNNSLEFRPSDVVIDSRKVTKGSLFIALKGDNFDGHDFIQDAFSKGASLVIMNDNNKDQVLNKLEPYSSEYVNVITVLDTKIALGQVAALVRKLSSAKVVALTGSSGKTSVKEMTYSILSQMGRVIATQGNFNNEIGVPLTLLQLTGQEDYAVIELGANHIGEIAYTASMSAPQSVLINSISAAHLEGFGSLLGVAHAKSEIFTFTPLLETSALKFIKTPKAFNNKNVALMMNADILLETSMLHDDSQSISAVWADEINLFWQQALENHKNVSYFSSKSTSVLVGSQRLSIDFTITNLVLKGNGSCFTLNTPKGSIEITLGLLGKHAISNALGAAALALSVGASLDAIKFGLESVKPVSGRLNPILLAKIGDHEQWLIDDSYNANVGSMKAAIETLSELSGYKIFVVGDMAELGDYSQVCHKTVGQFASHANIDAVYSVGEQSHYISNQHKNGRHFSSKTELINTLKNDLKTHSSSTFVVKGSRSASMEEIVKALKEK
ncbi:Mur ligase family protein [Thorsellia anophelis]|uniref:UDP-N-acetylmuramoyl-tripeptide--D-alanyl-D-alanine ligase n=1 Tax=Thorsellia anophelis DSM 18579 TaxID=1123402 RepID=A0A1H9ZC36_9GAMM|nr:Mur ligase family protein [Thorsellia anophelis]SES79109.1 UDP-N-acetylmuramoyl-tripeptide--D-alanyl-D-alanine ligase [Thorsellia anophelis DSM 18579]